MKTGSYGNHYFSVTWAEPVAGQTLELTASTQLHTAEGLYLLQLAAQCRTYAQIRALKYFTADYFTENIPPQTFLLWSFIQLIAR